MTNKVTGGLKFGFMFAIGSTLATIVLILVMLLLAAASGA